MKKFIFIITFILIGQKSFAQGGPPIINAQGNLNNVYFWYDKNGNRIKRLINIHICEVEEIPPNGTVGTEIGKRENEIDSIKLSPQSLGINVYPNPTINFVNMTINSQLEFINSKIFVFDINGKKLYEKNNVQNKTLEVIPMNQFPIGNYTIILEINDQKRISWKVVKSMD